MLARFRVWRYGWSKHPCHVEYGKCVLATTPPELTFLDSHTLFSHVFSLCDAGHLLTWCHITSPVSHDVLLELYCGRHCWMCLMTLCVYFSCEYVCRRLSGEISSAQSLDRYGGAPVSVLFSEVFTPWFRVCVRTAHRRTLRHVAAILLAGKNILCTPCRGNYAWALNDK